MIQKQVLCPHRVRRLLKADWSWVDMRFQRQFESKLSGDAIFLYFILVAVSDKNGLSIYSDNSLALMIRVSLPSLSKARQELLNFDLIAFEAPLVQVLSLPPDPQSRPRVSQSDPSTAEALDHVVNKWVGQSSKVADKHYLQVTDEHWASASAFRSPTGSSMPNNQGGIQPIKKTKNPANCWVLMVQ